MLVSSTLKLMILRLSPRGTSAVIGSGASTGVGLSNIQQRLNQAYGEEHGFEIQSSPGAGFSVIIALPFETREQIERGKEQAAEQERASDTRISNAGQFASDQAPAMATLQHKDVKT